ncbi:MAG: hypothetical protein OFPI_15040 [Osedax symbiont Rs2]|nr:MAG: hypothetical protein OFPI_15040 [Osedax symbiont Rs2]
MITLNFVMRANAVSCLLFGITFLVIPNQVTAFLATVSAIPKSVLFFLGVGLLINGLHLIWASLQRPLSQALVNYFSIGDFIWLLASISLVVMEIWIDTTAGAVTTLAVAIVVGGFGVMQKILSKRLGIAEV